MFPTFNEQTVQIKESIAVKDHMSMWDQPVSYDDFEVLVSSNSEFHLQIKESILISRDQPVLNKNEAFFVIIFAWLVIKIF